MLCLLERTSKDTNALKPIINFFDLITAEDSIIPMKYFPYFILANISIERE